MCEFSVFSALALVGASLSDCRLPNCVRPTAGLDARANKPPLMPRKPVYKAHHACPSTPCPPAATTWPLWRSCTMPGAP